MPQTALVLANGHLETDFAKTTHGIVRGPCRYRLLGVIDQSFAGQDAGVLLDGQPRDIPIYPSVPAMLAQTGQRPAYCIIGVATAGGVLPPDLYADLVAAARAGMTLVNGLHHLLSDEPELVRLTRENGGEIIDIRKPRPASELRFWSGEVTQMKALRIAVLGTDCAVGKRTTCMLLREACRTRGLRAEMIYTGQTGWLQGLRHGFIFDATLNDFVSGELERALLACEQEEQPDVIFMEGQSSLRNPSGPAGSEFILSGGARGVILQHAPAREYFVDLEAWECTLPPVEEEVEMIRLMGAEVWALTLNVENMTPGQARTVQQELAERLHLPVVLPLEDGMNEVVDVIQQQLKTPQNT